MIPFKNPRKIAEQIAWARDTKFREDNYDLANRNCEHFANMIIYGINYSDQVYDNRGKFQTKNVGLTLFFPTPSLVLNNYDINNGKGSTIKLKDEIRETNNKLGEKTNDRSEAIEARIEVPPRETCRIM